MARQPINSPRRMPVSTPDRGPSVANRRRDRQFVEPFSFAAVGSFIRLGSAGPTFTIPQGTNATLTRVSYYAALSIGSPYIPTLEIAYGGRGAYRNLLTDFPYVLFPEIEGEVLLDIDILPNTVVQLTEQLVDSSDFSDPGVNVIVVAQYRIEGELWRP